VSHLDHAVRLVSQLSEYLPESHSQLFRPSPFLLGIKPSPWEELTRSLTAALLSLGLNNPSLQQTSASAVAAYLANCTQAVNAIALQPGQHSRTDDRGEPKESAEIMAITVSFVGFLEASAHYTHFWAAAEKLDIIKQVQGVLSEDFLVAVETASSTIRNSNASDQVLRDWRRYSRRYAAQGRPLGAMLLQQGFMRFAKACTSTTVFGPQTLNDETLLDNYMIGAAVPRGDSDDAEGALVEHLASVIAEEIHLLEDGSDYLQLGSSWQQELAFSVKASALVGFLNCVILDDESADIELLLSWLEDTLADANQMASFDLATVTLKTVASIAKLSPSNASTLSRSLLRFIVQGGTTGPIVSIGAHCLAQVLNILSQDSVITTLYSLGNVLSPTATSAEKSTQHPVDTLEIGADPEPYAHPANESVISLSGNGEEETMVTHRNVIHAIVTIATSCNDDKIIALVQSMLLQKIGKINVAVDACIIQETATLALSNNPTEFQLLLKFYSRLHREGLTRGHSIIFDAVQHARTYLSVSLKRSSSLFRIYLAHLLESIISKGDVTDLENDRQKDIVLSPDDITPLLKPLILLVSSRGETIGDPPETFEYDEDTAALFRDAWFNIAVHGISLNSDVGRRYCDELRVLAEHSPPLVPENRTEVLESDVELNTILRRGMGPHRITEQKKMLISEFPDREADAKRLNYPKTIFLNASLLIESLRASSGDCTKILTYFLDPALNTSEMGSCMDAVADKVISIYLAKTLSGKSEEFSAPCLSKQLAEIFVACCHRIGRVQEVAVSCANKIISRSPSSLCQRHSLFALLDLLTVMWSSCLEGELDEFGWKSTFVSSRGQVRIELSDNYEFRRHTLDSFHARAKGWVTTVINIAPLDVKGLLQVSSKKRCNVRDRAGSLCCRRIFQNMRMTAPMAIFH
jgi:phosphatidylinositol 4-kinase